MSTIQTLSEFLVAKIAAGEVIERPVFAVKELVENAIDAGASFIHVEIIDAGLKKIIVSDNGKGMSREDLELAYLPHTTSKLSDEHALIGIRTLGFRGEALSSIAAISTLTLRSRIKNDPGGTEIVVRNGEVERISPIGTPPGTIVTVDNLFLNVPARKKFLKSEKTEFRLIAEIVMNYALANPGIHFKLMHNTKIIFDLPSNSQCTDRVRVLFGVDLFEHLLPITYEEGYLSLSGFIGKPQIASKQNQKQYLFINNRLVTDKVITQAVKDGFGTLLPASSTPVFLLNIKLPPEMVDVNVHPRKENVAFINNEAIYQSVKLAVLATLNEHNITFRMANFKNENSAKIGETTSFAGSLLKENVLPWNRTFNAEIDPLESLMQVHQTYIFSQNKEGMFFYDQHAAHERILFEKFTQAFLDQKKKKESSPLPQPITLNLSLPDSHVMDEYLALFEELGFTIEHFQGTSYLIRSIPVLFKGRNITKIITDMLTDKTVSITRDIDSRSQRMLAFLACRAAVKAGDLLSNSQMKDILTDLINVANNSTCPHGRPTRIAIPLEDLHKLFKRQ